MALATGSRFGRYEILAPLGAGGMGEVYLARDQKLDREVAIKVLPTGLTADPERLARFEREAKILASLSHPNIAALYELEDFERQLALVLEFVDGTTLGEALAARPAEAPLPYADVLRIARQIADALDAAHERGVIHRDLKPANIKLTSTGLIKLLDFGLAKSGAGDPALEQSGSPTRAIGGTQPGAVMGTVGYMSPEQARGLPVTKRADIWAFGCLLYEMLTGRMAFAGDTASDILVSILERTPDWAALPGATPPAIRTLIRRCLEKDPRKRLRDIGDARLELDDLLAQAGESAAAGRAVRRAAVQFSRLTDFPGHKETPAISPDGKMVAFVALVDGRRQIWVRMLAGGASLQVTRDPIDHEQPRWSPDSAALIYFTRPRPGESQGSIWQISALGGPARRIVAALSGADVSHDGQRLALFQPGANGIELVTVSRDGGHRHLVAALAGDRIYRMPRWSPDAAAIAYQRGSVDAFESDLEIISLETGERRQLVSSGVQGFCWSADGARLIFASWAGSTLLYPPIVNLYAVDRDGGEETQLTFGDVSYADPDSRSSDRLVATRTRSRSDIWRFPLGLSPAETVRGATRVTRQTGHVQTPSPNPDDSEIVYLSDAGGHANLWISAIDGSSARQITFEDDREMRVGIPVWSPRGDWIVFILAKHGRTSLAAVRPDGSERHAVGPERCWSASWSADGHALYFTVPHDGGLHLEKYLIDSGQRTRLRDEGVVGFCSRDESVLFLVNRLAPLHLIGRWSGEVELARLAADGASQTMMKLPGSRIPVSPHLFQPVLSPDDRWLAVPLTDGGTSNIWIQPSTGGDLRKLTDFGDRPVVIGRTTSWARDSQSIYAAVAEVEADIVLFDALV